MRRIKHLQKKSSELFYCLFWDQNQNPRPKNGFKNQIQNPGFGFGFWIRKSYPCLLGINGVLQS